LSRDEFFKQEIEDNKGKVLMKTILNCPKIQKTSKTFDQILAILQNNKTEFEIVLEGESHSLETTFITSNNIANCLKESKLLEETDIILKVIVTKKSTNKIFFNDLEYTLNEH